MQAELDYIDNHAYWCHPSPVHANWRIHNAADGQLDVLHPGLAGQRVLGKPYTVSEYNHPFPNQYGAEGQPMLRAYGRAAGLGRRVRVHLQPLPRLRAAAQHLFLQHDRADRRAGALPGLRGHVPPRRRAGGAARPSPERLPLPDYFDRLVPPRSVAASIASAGFDGRLTLLHKTAVDLSGKPGTEPAAIAKPDGEDRGERHRRVDLEHGSFPAKPTGPSTRSNTKLFSGFPEGREIALGGVTLALGETRLDWATVSLVSRRATGFGDAARRQPSCWLPPA